MSGLSRLLLVTLIAASVLMGIALDAAASDSQNPDRPRLGEWWRYDAQVYISSLTLEGQVSVTYMGQSEVEVEGTFHTLDVYSWNGSMDISGYKVGAIATGTAFYGGREYVSPSTGYVVMSDTNLTMDFCTCVGSLDEAHHVSWNHRYVSYLPIEGNLVAHMSDAQGSTWSREAQVHRIANGTYYLDHVVNEEFETTETLSFSIVSRHRENVSAGEFQCTVLRCAVQEDSETLWISEDVKRPVRIERDFDYVDAYYSGETWALSLVSYSEEESWGLGVWAALGVCCVVASVASVVAISRRRRLAQ